MHQMDFISQEVNRMESTGRLIEEQARILNRTKIALTIIELVLRFTVSTAEGAGARGRGE